MNRGSSGKRVGGFGDFWLRLCTGEHFQFQPSLVVQATGVALDDARSVVQLLEEPERELVLRVEVDSNTVAMTIADQSGLPTRSQPLPFGGGGSSLASRDRAKISPL